MNALPVATLGEFELSTRIGEGGMGEVYRAVHRTQGIPVAVKVITGEKARESLYRSAFRNEVRSVAALDHPGIILVFDHGEIPRPVAEATDGRLVAGSPYLVMELADGGDLQPAEDWSSARATLRALLEALGHAHARGVVHRDLKPSNILLAGGRPVVTDFSIARPSEVSDADTDVRLSATGTPHYMAPEQARGDLAAQGPTTDLYALGCLAWWLVCGSPVFKGARGKQVLLLQMEATPPEFPHRIALPEGFERWVRCLLEKRPEARFQCAADAAAALSVLDGPMVEPSAEVLAEDRAREAPTRPPMTVELSDELAEDDLDSATLSETRVTTATDPTALPSQFQRITDPLRPLRAPPPAEPPGDWRETSRDRRSLRLVGAGLGLFGLRAIPLVDREDERTALWESVAEVRRTGRAAAVVLRGSAGIGKSRLASWLCERCLETGAAFSMRALHGPLAGPRHGLGAMLARDLGVVGMPRPRVFERARTVLRSLPSISGDELDSEVEVAAMTEMVVPSSESARAADDEVVYRFANAKARHEALYRFLRRRAASRPLVVWLDDVQWGPDALDFAQHVLTAQSRAPAPLLLLTTARDETLTERPVEREQLDTLRSRPDVGEVKVGPLTDSDQARLIEELLYVEPALAAQVVGRSGGNPLFAVQLVGDWVERGVLRVGETGFQLTEGEGVEIPDDIFRLWETRIAALVQRVGPDAAEDTAAALQLAATLGTDVDSAEWMAAARLSGVHIPEALVSQMLESRLAVGREAAWSFAHGMLRESLERQSEDAGRRRDLHRACGNALLSIHPEGTVGVAERAGRHFLEAEAWDDALTPLLVAAREVARRGEMPRVTVLCAMRQKALEALGVPLTDVRWAETWVEEARARIRRKDIEGVQRLIDLISENSVEGEDSAPRAEALRLAGGILTIQGRLDEGEPLFREAQERFAALGDELGIARTYVDLGNVAYFRGKFAESAELHGEALVRFQRLGDDDATAGAMRARAAKLTHLDRPDEARALLEESARLRERIGNRYGLAFVLNDLGELARLRGRLDEAEETYLRAVREMRAMADPDAAISVMNLALVHLAREDFEKAGALLPEARTSFAEAGRKAFSGIAGAIELGCLASLGRWADYETLLAEVEAALAGSKHVDVDAAAFLDVAVRRAASAGREDLARPTARLALPMLDAIGKAAEAAELRELLGIRE